MGWGRDYLNSGIRMKILACLVAGGIVVIYSEDAGVAGKGGGLDDGGKERKMGKRAGRWRGLSGRPGGQ